jgi:hypothetical protein
MPKSLIALLISGRATGWDNCLLPILNASQDYEIHVFMSINNKNKNCYYFNAMKEQMKKYVKGCFIKQFVVPDDFHNTSTHVQTVKQLVNEKYVPLNILSMYWNYQNAFNMACEYQTINNIKYDRFMTFRADIIIDKIPVLPMNNNTLYTINQPCQFTGFGNYNESIVSPEWTYGDQNIMEKYVATYDYILEQTKHNSDYICHYESNCTDNCHFLHLDIIHIPNIRYKIDANRRRFDNWADIGDTRITNINNRTIDYQDINTVTHNNLYVAPIKN